MATGQKQKRTPNMSNLAIEPIPANSSEKVSLAAIYPHMPHMELSEEYLTRRFSRPSRRLEHVVYEMSRDAGLLHQYHLLREEMFISVWGLKKFSGKKDDYDDKSDVMIARIGNHCIAGCRLTFSHPEAREPLPMEKNNTTLTELLPQLNLGDVRYVEVSRMAIFPDFQNSLVMLELSRQLLKRAAEKKARYAFTLAPAPLARNYRKAAHLFGLKWQILNEIEIPERIEYEGIPMVLSMLDLAPVYRPKTKATRQLEESQHA
jgi:hypothetical protein